MNKQINIRSLIVSMSILLLLMLTMVVLGQDVEPVEPFALSSEPVILEFSTGATGPPTVKPLTDGRITFRISVAGEVTGTINGEITGQVSEVHANPGFHPVTVMFTIETEQGTVEGFYIGNLYLAEGSDRSSINASGKILSVSGAYADLYLADVFVTSGVQYVDGRSVGESGTMTIISQ